MYKSSYSSIQLCSKFLHVKAAQLKSKQLCKDIHVSTNTKGLFHASILWGFINLLPHSHSVAMGSDSLSVETKFGRNPPKLSIVWYMDHYHVLPQAIFRCHPASKSRVKAM